MSALRMVRNAEVGGRIVDVRIEGGRIAGVSPASERRAAPGAAGDVLDAGGGGLLPGLHDHHIHLLALAAAARSVRVGPADVRGPGGFAAALRAADAAMEPARWIRAVGYHESVAGPLDRHELDAIVERRPVRVQHRSGAMWVLNSTAATALGLVAADVGAPAHAGGLPEGVDVAAGGSPTGRLYGLDAWLAGRVPHETLDLAGVGRSLLDFGVTGVTDATPTERNDAVALLAAAVAAGSLPQEVLVMGGPALDPEAGAPLERGPVKLVVADHRLPGLDRLTAAVGAAHRARRAVAVHCVTRAALLLALAAWDETGAAPGDRIEHGAVIHPEDAARIAAHGLTVVTQPAFVAERGDDYLADVEGDDRPHLWRCAGLLRAGISVGGGTDAPFGPADPWQAVAAAVHRRTRGGRVLGDGERVSPRRALDLFLGPAHAPGGPPRRVRVGAPADLCLLAVPLEEALGSPSASMVAATIRDGRVSTPRRGR